MIKGLAGIILLLVGIGFCTGQGVSVYPKTVVPAGGDGGPQVWTNDGVGDIVLSGTNSNATVVAIPTASTNTNIRLSYLTDKDFPSAQITLEAQNTNGDLSFTTMLGGPGSEELYMQRSPGAVAMDLWPGQADSPGVILNLFNTFGNRTQATGKLLSVQNNGVERFYIGNLTGRFGLAGLDYDAPITNALPGQALTSNGNTPQQLSWSSSFPDSFSGNLSINWNARLLYDEVGNPSVDWSTVRKLLASDGTFPLDWQNRKLQDASSLEILRWNPVVMLATNAIAKWPSAAATRGGCAFVNSNATVYILTSTPNSTVWAATNKIAGP